MQFTVPAVLDAVAATIGDRVLLTQGDRRYTYAQVVERSNRLASYLHARGLGCHTARDTLAGHEVGQDQLGIYAHNGNEFVESARGSARVASFNVNYRYVKKNCIICSPTPVRRADLSRHVRDRGSPTSCRICHTCGCSSRWRTIRAIIC